MKKPPKYVAALEQWYERMHRPLPWRLTQDPYPIWVSEVMLQQTQVNTVLPYYERFLKKFPNLEKLAAAPLSSVLAAWSGLGYYSRARNLHAGAQYLVEHYEGTFPRDRSKLLKVPGIGPYTAGAILSIAFNMREPLVDSNIQRVFARYFGVRQEIHVAEVKEFFWNQATDWVKCAHAPRILNQALMELGATLCTKSNPACMLCPLLGYCVAQQKGLQNELPRRAKRREMEEVLWVGYVFENHGKVFLQKNKKGEWWADLWDIPKEKLSSTQKLQRQIDKCLRKHPEIGMAMPLSRQQHTVTHHKISFYPHLCHVEDRSVVPFRSGKWFAIHELPSLPTSSLVKKVFRSLSREEDSEKTLFS